MDNTNANISCISITIYVYLLRLYQQITGAIIQPNMNSYSDAMLSMNDTYIRLSSISALS